MLPALVLFRPLWTEPARARCISSLRYPNAFWPECYRVPCFFYAYLGRIFPTIHTNLWNPIASYCHCVLSPYLRIAPVPCLGTGGIGIGGLYRALSRFSCDTLNPSFGCGRQVPHRKRPLKSGSRGGFRIEFFIK